MGAANGVAKKALRGSWTKDQKRQIVAESQVAGANLAELYSRGARGPYADRGAAICQDFAKSADQAMLFWGPRPLA